ncbi:unnamed protein product [Trichobilharzia regenti]|nr:unnamed protein product [Trichobilharzia regenti]
MIFVYSNLRHHSGHKITPFKEQLTTHMKIVVTPSTIHLNKQKSIMMRIFGTKRSSKMIIKVLEN